MGGEALILDMFNESAKRWRVSHFVERIVRVAVNLGRSAPFS